MFGGGGTIQTTSPAANPINPTVRQRPGNTATERNPSAMAGRMKGDNGSR